MSIFCRPLGHLHLRRPEKRNRAICPYDYIRYGETCSIGSAWVGARAAAFDENGHNKVWGSKWERMGIRSVFLGAWLL